MIENKTNLKKKLLNHLTKSGKKQISEKALIKSFKATQKSQKKNHYKIVKLSLLNTTPTFKIVKLKNKKRRKSSIKEIPTFLSNSRSRTSWSFKYLVKTASSQTNSSALYKKLKNELLLGAKAENNVTLLKNKLQQKTIQEKKYFRNFRW